jgi:hypothetical protein
MPKEKPLIHAMYLLEKYPGKGGWTFARIPEVAKSKNKPFGTVKVRGSIDGIALNQYHLMPMGDGHLFLPVKAEIRKKIGKKEGDYVEVILFHDNEPLEIPNEMLECLKDEPASFHYFQSLSESEKKYYVQWIYSSKKEETKIRRMGISIERLAKGLKLYEQKKPE